MTGSSENNDNGLSTGAIIGIAAGGGAALLVVVVIFIIFCCYCYCKKRQDETNVGPVITTRYWDTNHPNDAGPGHVTSGGTLHSRNSWRDSLRSFTRGSLRRSFSLRRSAKRPTQEKQQQPPNGLISTPI